MSIRRTRVRAARSAGLFAVATLLAAGALAQEAPKGEVEAGRVAYQKAGCWQCHGHAGQGGVLGGAVPALARNPMPVEGFRFFVRQPPGTMPAYTASVLSEQALTDIYAYIQSMSGRSEKVPPILDR